MVGMRADVTLNVNTSKAKRSMDRAAAELNRSINGVGKKQISFNVNGKSFTQPLGRITASANEFTKSLEASNARVIAFGASVGIINGISEAFKALVVETVKFEKVLQDINVIVGASAGKLQEFGDGLFDVARNTAQAFTVSAEAALEFSRQGLTMEETLRRTNDALILTRLTGLDAASAVSGLTAAVNAFGDAGLSTTDIIDKLAAVDVKFAVSSEDLIKALERTGAVAIDAGVEIDSLIGLVTALQQTTARGGAVIGNGLKTIFTRIQRPESIRQLEDIGIAVKNLSGSILPADKIMVNMAKSFDNLSQSQQSNIVQFSAGIFQANVFRAALRDLGKEQSIQAQATEIAGNAAGDAAQKNEMLNKTMSAMASQTTTSIQELAEILGTIGLAPDIDFFLSSIKDGIDGIKNTLGGGEDEGSTFAKGLVKGIGNVITGPAAIAFGAIFIKLFVNIAKFARTSLKDVLGIVNEKDKIRAMEESILKALGENVKLQEGLSNLEDDRKAQEMFILGIIEKQNSAMSEQVSLAARLAKPLVKAGINPDFSKNEASGMVPVAASGMIPESSKKKERQGAAKGGYAAGAIDSMNVKGVGTVVYNKAEKVKQFPGMSQPAIMPPKESRAGKGYRDAFAGQHGFDPYASGGLVPNFARMDGSKLILDKSLTKLSANPYNVKGSDELKKNYAELEASGRPITVEAKMSQLVNNSGGSHTKKLKNVLRFLGEKGGVEGVSREFDLQKLPYRGRKNEKAAEEAVLKSEGKPYFSTGGSSGDPTFPVDLVGLGKNPLEVKSGQWKLPNVLLKSMRLYSDDGLLSFAKQKLGVDEQMIQEARYEKFKKGSNLLLKKKIIPKGSTDEEKHQSLLDHRMSEGLVPNFAQITGGVDTDFVKKYFKLKKYYNDSDFKQLPNHKLELIDFMGEDLKSISQKANSNLLIKGKSPKKKLRMEHLGIDRLDIDVFREIYNKIPDKAVYDNAEKIKNNEPFYRDVKNAKTLQELKTKYGIKESAALGGFIEKTGFGGNSDFNRAVTKLNSVYGPEGLNDPSMLQAVKLAEGALNKTRELVKKRTEDRKAKKIDRQLKGPKGSQFLKGHAFEKLIVNQGFNRTYNRGPGAIDIEGIDKKYFNKDNKKNFDIDGEYDHGDPIYTSSEEGHGESGVLVKLANSEKTNMQIINKINGFKKSKIVPGRIDLGAFSFADMIGGTSLTEQESVNGLVKKDGEKLKNISGSKKSDKPAPGILKNLPDGTELAFSYIRDYLKPVKKQADFLKGLESGPIPSSEEVAKGERIINRKGFEIVGEASRGFFPGGIIPNFADPRTRSQKIQDTLADPSNKGIKFNKPPSPANITSAQISRQLDIPIGKTPETQPSDEDIKNAINTVAQTRERLQLPGYENLKSIDKTKILKKYKKQAGEGEYYGNKDLSAAKGFIPNYKKLYQAYVGSDGSGGQTVRRNRNGDQWYYDSQKGTDGILEDWTKVKAKLPMGENVQDMYSREYSITDKNLKQMTSGVYDAKNLRKLRVMSKAFEANNELPDQNDEEWEEDYLNTGGNEWEEANDEMEGRLGAYSRLRRTGKQDFLWKDSMAGTITNPQPLASYEKNMFGPGYVIPQLGNEAMFRDGFTNEDGDKIRSIFSQNLNKDNHLVERKLTDEYLDNQNLAKDLSQATESPDKAMNAARQRGIKSIGDHMNSKGLIPNFADLSKSKRLKSFQDEYEDLAKMGSPLAKWALKTVKDKEFKMIGHGVESWAIGNEEVVYKLPRPQINSFNRSGDLELERWRRQMKVMAQPSLQYKVSPENKAWNLVPDSNIAKRAERIRSQLDSSGIDSLFLPNTEVLKVAGQDEFITSQERVKGSTFLNLQNEILKSKKNKTDFNLDGYKIVEHLMENISGTGMIRDVHSGNFIAEASKKKQLLNTVNQFAPIGSKESKPLSKLGLRGLPDDSIAAIDFSSGLIPNFADLYKPYSSKGGKPIGSENYFYNSNNQEDALSYIKSNEHLGRKRGTSELRKFSFAPRVWEMLTSKSPQNIEPRMNVLPLGIRTPVGKDDPYRDTSLGKQMSEQEDFAAIASKNAYGIKPPFFEKRNSWRNGETYSTLMTNSPQFTEMYKLSRSNGENVVPNFAKTFYDFDETLATYPSSVTSADLFNAESAALAEPTDLAKSLKGRTLDILTARAGESKPFISKKLKSWGINSGRIITTGSIQNGQTSAQKKATILQNMQKKNGGQYNLIDDAPENIAAIKALGNKNLMGQLYKFSGQHAGRGSGNAEGLVPNFSRVEQVQKSQKRRVKEQVTEEDKDLAHNIFDYLKTNISNLSSRFRFNRSTVSFGGNPEDYEKVFNHSSSRKNKENLIEIARSEMRMNRILKGFMIPHTEGVSAARGKHKAPRDPFLDGAMHGGLVPNFADPLSAAISRERAAGVPQARIRVEKSSQLKSAQNPMGLAVTNTRDEPAGVQQGIRRAKTMGIDPKKHGASKGMVPNFATPQTGNDAIQKIQNAINPLVEENLGSLKKIIENIGNAAVVFGDEFSEDIKKASTSLKESFNMDKLADELQLYIQHAEDSIKKINEKPNKSEKDNKELLGLNKFKSESQSALSGMGGLKEAKALKDSVKQDSSGPEAQKAQLKKVENELLKRSNKANKDNFKSIMEATKASQDFRIAMDESARSAQESEDDGGGLQRLFYLQSAISLVNGQFETLAEGASGLTKTFAQGMLAISNVTASYIQQKELVSEGMNMAGVKRNESFNLLDPSSFASDSEQGRARKRADAKARGASIGKGPLGKMGGLMRNLSGVGRMFGRFLPVVGQLYTGFTVVNEAFKMITSMGNIGELLNLEKGAGIMDLLSTQGERAAKKLEKLGESTEKLQGALESLNSQAENREKVTDLEILGSRRTQKQELELQQLKLKGLDIDIKAQDALSGLLDENLVGTKVSKRFIEELSKGTNSNEDYVKTIQRSNKSSKDSRRRFLLDQKVLRDLIDKKLDKFTAGSGDDIKLLQGAVKS